MTTLIKQKGLSDCVLASISMAAGHETWEQLWNEDDLATVFGKGIWDEEPWMLRAGFVKNVDYIRIYVHEASNNRQIKAMLWNRRAMVSCNSLNTPDGGHMLYWDGKQLFDPSTQNTFQHLNTLLLTGVLIFKD